MQFNNWIIYLLLAVILVLIIILYWRTSNFANNIESFATDEKLGKQKTTDYNNFHIWSNKITAMSSTNLVKPISFWSPNLKTSKNLGYLKLGDTVSTDNNFIPPTNELVVVKGDIVQPSSYSKITQITNPILDKFTPTQRDNYIHLLTNIKDFNKKNAISSAFSSIINMLDNMQDSLRSYMRDNVLNIIGVYRYASVYNQFEHPSISNDNFFMEYLNRYYNNDNTNKESSNDGFIKSQTFKDYLNYMTVGPTGFIVTQDKNDDLGPIESLKMAWRESHWSAGFIKVVSTYQQLIKTIQKDEFENYLLETKPVYWKSGNKIEYGSEYLVVLPMGFSINYNDDMRPQITITTGLETVDSVLNLTNNVNTTINQLPKDRAEIKDAGNGYSFRTVPITQDITVPLSNLVSSNDLAIALNNSISSIQDFVSPELFTEIKDIIPFINDYISTLSVVYRNNVNVVRCVDPNHEGFIWDFIKTGKVKITMDKNFAASVNNKIDTINFSFDSANSANASKPFGKMLNKLIDYVNILDNFQIGSAKEIPLVIYRPVCTTPDYTGLGDIVFGAEADLNSVKQYPTLACIPITCVKDVRRWKTTDIVYENASPYFAIYYNPYTGTFRTSTTKDQTPDGMVQKVISCIQGCKAVDNLIKSDQCAKQISKMNTEIMANTPVLDTSAVDEEDEYYRTKISRRDNNIGTIKNGIELLKLRSEQTDSILKAKSRQELQSYLDNQGANINTVRKRLEQDNGHTEVNINIPAKINIQRVLIDTIKNSDLPNKDDVIARILAAQRGKNDIISRDELNSRIDDVLSHCPDVNPNLIKKSVIRNLCYGCNI